MAKSCGVTIQNETSRAVLSHGICDDDDDDKVVLTSESVHKILWCDHSNETSLPVLSHGAICFATFYKNKIGNFVEI